MKITAVKTKTYLYPYKEGEEFANGIRWNRARSCVLVIVETDEGITGYGESDSAGAPPEVTACIVEKYIGPLVIGMDPMCVEAVWSHVYSHCDKNGRRGMAIAALSGVDIALWDIMGKAYGVPVYQLLGGKTNERIRAYASQLQFGWGPEHLFLTDPEDYAKATRAALELACSEARAAGVPLETVLDLCRRTYGEM